MELVELRYDLVGAGSIVVRVAQEQGFSYTILEAAGFIDGVTDIEQTVVRIEIDEDSDAAGRVAAQRDDDHGAVAIEIGAFLEGFVGTRIEFQGGRVGRWKFLRMGRDDQALDLDRGIESELQLFAGEKNRNAREIHQTTSVIEVDVGENDPANFLRIAADETQEFADRHFRSELAGDILGYDAEKERVGGDFVIEVHRIAGVDEQIP